MSAAAAGSGWKCSRCTFYHHAPGSRCAMCNELRVSRQQMRDFVIGKPIPNDDAVSPRAKSYTDHPQACSQSLRSHLSQQQTILSTLRPKSASSRAIANPYAKPLAVSQQQQSESVNKTPSSPIQPHVPSESLPLPQHTVTNRTTSSTSSAAGIGNKLHRSATSDGDSNPSDTGRGKNPFIALKPRPVLEYKPGPVPIDESTAHEWVYPTAETFPKRQYQLEITETALFHNTLVSLPTGLGKTLIAAAVLYNYYRWFPTGKVIFLAPTLPLVNQQVKACYDIMGIPPSDTAVLTGKVHAARREIVWRDRRVFFCTPQTVQKDLDANRCDSSKVVCVVLDEAHKSTGDYAYVKVVERLEEAGAHFRVLGLSATPGTNIKAIQSVVDVLRINKIEARRDSDPSVARYIHEKQSEIVVVKQASASRTIERALNDVVGPLLERLRSAGALGRLTGNATITAYNLIRAREEFCKRQNDDGLIGFFLAAQQFVQIRSDLHKHGVGLVRSKLSRLRTERQRGMVASIVKGKEFQALWEEVAKSTCDPNSNHNNVQDKLVNNPKLTQLREILVEHFERARACSTSSRAIVFSQFRDSVSEIVDILSASRPLIRPRHFVGQGKGTKGEGGIQLKGMRQVEQQQAIREFREDTFNVLVCTCIGEEGLDIGEVDLIVNFDTLRSPIRMIQRTGRTGRKRDGRVVCLVAEGPEERTLLASRQSERNLAHALKNPKSFRVAQTMPLFPSQPKLREQNMLVSKDFHISQVEGHEGTRRKVLGPFDARNSQSAQEKIRWRLVTKEENERESALGRILVSKGCSEVWRTSLRRRFLLARSLSNISDTRRLNYTTGRTVRILADLRYSHGVNVSHNYSKTHSRGHGWTLEHLFPLKFDSLIGKGLHGEILPVINQSLPKNLLVELDVLNKGSMETIFRNDHGCVGRNSILGQKGFVRNKKTRETNTEHSEGEHYLTKEQTEAFGIDAPPHEARRNCRRRIQQEEAKKRPLSSSGVDILGQESMMSKFDLASTANDKENEPHCAWTGSTTVETSIVDEFILPTADQDYDTDERAQDEFVLPPTEDLSSSSDEEESRPAYESVIPRTSVAHNTGSFAGASYFPMSEHETTTVDSNQFYYRLPTQSDSSSDEDDETAMASRYVVNSQSKTASKQVAVSSSIRDKQRSSGLRSMARFGLETSSECSFDDLVTTDSIRDASVIESPDSQAKTKATTRRAIEDTPESTISPRVSLAEPLQGKNELTNDVDGLLDTQDDVVSGVSDIVCAVCFSGESVDDDPIVLCDGRGKGETCNLAVHATCYSIPISCLGDAEWFCDLCRFPTNPSQPAPSCSHCHQEGGSLRRMPSFEWSHPLCPMNQNNEARRAGFKRLRKIPKRKSLPLDLSSQIDMYHADDNTNVPKRKLRQYRCFLDEEAGIDSDEDIDGDRMEDEELDAIEDEEAAMSSFINDSSQLGQTQDELDLADPPAPEDCVHRQLDLDRERKTVFSTPLLNRRMKRRKGRDSWTPTPASAPDSEKGLGNMHFIRSVIEHHRRGGDSEAIEQLYRMEEDQSVDESGALDCEQTLRPRIVHYCNSDSD